MVHLSFDILVHPIKTVSELNIQLLPWGICIANPLEVVKEKVPIIDAYLKFAEWAESGGVLYPDWYLDKPGYRNEENLIGTNPQ